MLGIVLGARAGTVNRALGAHDPIGETNRELYYRVKSSVTGREGVGSLGPQIRTQPQTRWVREGPVLAGQSSFLSECARLSIPGLGSLS